MLARFAARPFTIAIATLLLTTLPSVANASYTSTLSGLAAVMTGDASGDTLVIVDESGLFRHNRFTAGDGGFASDLDFDSTMPGVQTLSSTTGSITVNAGDGDDTITLGDGVNLRGAVDGGIGDDTLDYTAFTTAMRANLGVGTNGLLGTMGGNQEAPPTSSPGTGTAMITNYDSATGTFDLDVDVIGILSADVIGFHIHRAAAGVNGPIIVDFTSAPRVPESNGFGFTATGLVLQGVDEAAFLGGGTYINVHTAEFPGGAIRGQLFTIGNVNLPGGFATGTTAVASVENLTGGSGGDSLVGSFVANTLSGGGGVDWLVGGPAADTLNGDTGADFLIWSNGDGSDVMEGGPDADTVLVNGSAGGDDVFTVSANGTRVDFDRISPGPFSLDIGTSETLTVNGINGADSVTVNDLAGVADLTMLNLNGFEGNDAFVFVPASSGSMTFNVHGGNGSDTVQGPESAATWNVTAAGQGNLAGLVSSFRFVETLTGGSATDTFTVKGFATAALTVNGGGGSDTLGYDAEFRLVAGDTAPPDGSIESAGVQPVAFTQTETVNIVNPAPTITINDVTSGEGSTATFMVNLSSASPFTITVNFATADGSAVAPGDYAAQNGTLTFMPGDMAEPIAVPLASDGPVEPAETFVVNLSSAANATIGDAQGLGTIVNNAPPTISPIADQTVPFNTATGDIPFTIGDAETLPASLMVAGTSSNAVVVPPANIVFGGSGANRTVTVTPAANQVGTTTMTVIVTDVGGATGSSAFQLTVSQPTTVQPPAEFRVSSVIGGLVTFRFTPAAIGPPATGFVIEGGVSPGSVQASLPTPTDAPIMTVVVPTGSFFARVHATRGLERSAASAEIPVHVNVPVVPTAPDLFSSAVNGNSVALAWRNTFGGGPPTDLVLDVTGSIAASFSLGVTESFATGGVPPGTYLLNLRAVNGGGSSAASGPVTVTIPSPCLSPPEMPANFLGYRVGNHAFVVWEPASTGPAAASYVLNVSGSFTGSFGTTARTISGQVGPGSYTVSVTAMNACGASPATPGQTIVVP